MEHAPSGYATVSVAAILAETAARLPEKTALIVGEQSISYRALWQQTLTYAGALRDRGVTPGQAVAILIPNVPDFPRAYYAILALGGIVVPIHALLKAEEIAFVLKDSGSTLLISAAPLLGEGAKGAALAGVDVLTLMMPPHSNDESLDAVGFDRLEDLAAEAVALETYVARAPEDTATILYTSGTTGHPKGAEGSHFSLVEQTSTLLLGTFDMSSDDVLLGCLPLFHTFGQTCVLNTGIRAGATIVLMPKFDGAGAIELITQHGCTIFFGVPTMYMVILAAAGTEPIETDLRYGVSGGAAIPVAIIERFTQVFGVDIHEGYGLTETSPVASFNRRGVAPRPGTIGTPIWGVDVEIARAEVDEAIELLPRGELGELVIRGHNLMKGYLHRDDDTQRSVVDGWFRTGDLGTKDDDGYLRILDRKKDMILRNGYNVYPREVEEVLAGHPDVSMAAVYGIAHEVHGQEVVAAVVLSPSATATAPELVEFAKEHVAAYKYPREVAIVDALPMGPSGKVLKRELVARHGA
ncbi:long-chain fatty acid--CoA ligase [Agreia sp. COWG]|uniref:long-chain-fatty-acid--CoA ligase n=1 Tax=Agreia sp. COWG TaxID=2773266 RepID=UPI0019287799|nr:long-chain fatty acid--CoA ligase [Agreia sp. COWG]CAD6006612.1 Long-chain fatty acid--CoA ligase [Agreia sp. COWG]